MTSKSPGLRLDLAFVAHEISDGIKALLEQYDAKLVLCKERGQSTLQVHFADEHDTAITLITARTNGNFQFVAIGDSLPVKSELPPGIDPGDWMRWEQYRNEERKPLSSRSRKAQLRFLGEQAAMGMSTREIIDNSIRNGYTGLFPVKTARRVQSGAGAVDAFVGGGR